MEMLHDEGALNGSKELSGRNLQNQQRNDHSALAESMERRNGHSGTVSTHELGWRHIVRNFTPA